MADVFSSEKRSSVMSKIRGKDTKPEVKVRKALHGLGYRYSLHKKELPGKPDLYFKKYNAVVEINGCYWHGHNCHLFSMPKSNTEFWKKKINGNKKRDERNIEKLKEMGFRVLIIWECAIKGKTSLQFDSLIKEVEEWINSESNFMEIQGNN